MVNSSERYCLVWPLPPLQWRTSKVIDLDDPLVWTAECELAFQAVSAAIREAPMLSKPNWGSRFFVATDASNVGLGAVLFQGSRYQPRYTVCVSRALTGSECNYSATKKELLGVMFALRRLRLYLADRRFTMYTDHKALAYMFQQKKLNDVLGRWLDGILDFDFEIEHLPGVVDVLPDYLSTVRL